MIFLLSVYLLSVVYASDELYIKRCVRSAEPWSVTNNPAKLVHSVDTCLSRSYLTLPPEYRQPLTEHIQQCIHSMRQMDLSRRKARQTFFKISNGRKVARMAPTSMIFGPIEWRRCQLNLETFPRR